MHQFPLLLTLQYNYRDQKKSIIGIIYNKNQIWNIKTLLPYHRDSQMILWVHWPLLLLHSFWLGAFPATFSSLVPPHGLSRNYSNGMIMLEHTLRLIYIRIIINENMSIGEQTEISWWSSSTFDAGDALASAAYAFFTSFSASFFDNRIRSAFRRLLYTNGRSNRWRFQKKPNS